MKRLLRPFILLIIVCMIPISVHMIGGTGSRYFTDDYCIWAEASDADPIALTAEWYNTSGGRLAQYLSMAMLFKADVYVAPLIPALLLTLWISGVAWLCTEVAAALHIPLRLGIVSGLFITSADIAAAPNLVQAIYWVTGILTYPLPAVIGNFIIALIVRAVRHNTLNAGVGVAIFLLSLTSGLFNEPFALMQCALIGAGILVTGLAARSRRTLWLALGVAAVATAVAIAILVLAPGNSIRQVSFGAQQSLFTALVQSVQYSVTFTFAGVVFNPLGVVAMFFIGSIIPGLIERFSPDLAYRLFQTARHRSLWAFLIGAVLWIGVCAAFMLPGFYATGSPPPARGFIMPLWAYLPWCIAMGVLVRLNLSLPKTVLGRLDTWNMRIAVIVIILHGFWATSQSIPVASYVLQSGREWDARAAEIAAADTSDSILWVPLRYDLAAYAGLVSIAPDHNHWVNLCAAEYFNVAAIRAVNAAES